MELIRGRDHLSAARGCALTIGNYDGVHLGHRAMIGVLKQRAAALGCVSAVLAFEPSSKEFLDPEDAPPRLTRWREKFTHLAALGVDHFVTLRFDERMRATTPEAFVRELLVEGLGVRHVVVGPDFRYGCRAAGTVDTLRAAGGQFGFEVEQIGGVAFEGERISSTRVRAALARADYTQAARLLGWRYRMTGRVAHGKKLGRSLGFPTANLPLKRRKSPVWGIMAVRVHGIEAAPLPAVASLGTRPTVNGVEPLLEVHVFDFDGDLYGRPIEVEFVRKLRDEVRFDSLDALVAQMNVDAAQARAALAVC
ncbi:MAG: bifunctional riboflavin kinase/FAD synthetase [Proteobacteria bacterium]|nr:bifunctional riboflavin kinase/FAD synthetase [Pseudomonadota bacterium]